MELVDQDGDGVFDRVVVTGSSLMSGPVDFSVDVVTFDITGDGFGDYMTLPSVGSGLCQNRVAQIFVPLADCSGDGIPDCVALGTTTRLPQYLPSPTLVLLDSLGNDVRRANREGGQPVARLRLVRQPPHAVRFAGRMSFRTNAERFDNVVPGA